MGKTKWARCHGTHTSWMGRFRLDKFDPESKYAVWDDVRELPWSYKQWLGGQEEFEISDKYARVRTIEWGKPCIFLCNAQAWEMIKKDPHFDSEWWNGNVITLHVDNKLY